MPRQESGTSRATWIWASLLLVTLAANSRGGELTPLGTQSLSYPLVPPSDCASCHADYDAVNHIEPWNTWAGSMMANASRDPIFWAALDVANRDGEALGVAGIGEFCLRCHSPAGWLAGRADAGTQPTEVGDADGCALQGRIDQPDGDFTGLDCHFCHRLQVNENPDEDKGEESVYFENGNFWLDDSICSSGMGMRQEPCRRGPYDYQSSHSEQPPHEWAWSDYLVSNDICGNCHNVTNPLHNLLDADGNDLGVGFPIERTFKEWQQSAFSDLLSGTFANCSSCHMPDADANPVYASSRGWPNRCSNPEDVDCTDSGGLPIHQFAGGNTWIPQVLKGEYRELGRAAAFDATTTLAFDLLQNRAAGVEIESASAVDQGSQLLVDVRVTNLSGHKLPTGYGEGRRMWLHVILRDEADQILWQSGAWDAATGKLASSPKPKVYEVQQGIWDYNDTGECDVEDIADGRHLFHFVRNNCIALDNRIPPLGFRPRRSDGQLDPETAPVGYEYPETAPGSGELVNRDTTRYVIPIAEAAGSKVSVEATLYYQTASDEYIEFLRDQAVESEPPFPDDCLERADGPIGMTRGEYLYALWTDPDYGRSLPVDMGNAATVVDVHDLFSDGFESGDASRWSSGTP